MQEEDIKRLRETQDEKLTPAQESELKFLKQQVDMWHDKVWGAGVVSRLPNAKNNLFVAQDELDNYVKSLRTWGKKI